MVFSEGDEEEKLRCLMAHGCKEEYRRCLAVLLRAQGMPNQDIAGMLGADKRSVERWIKAYRAGGVAGLMRRPHSGRRPRITPDKKKIIAEMILQSPTAFGYLKNEWSVRLLSKHLTKETGITISKSLLWNILKELKIVYKRPKAVVKSRDPDYEEKAQMVGDYKEAASSLLKGGLP